MLQVSYRSSECDHKHIFLIYSYILYVVAVISHTRGGGDRDLSYLSLRGKELKKHTELTKEQNFMLEFNIVPCYILPWLIGENEHPLFAEAKRHYSLKSPDDSHQCKVKAHMSVQGVVFLEKATSLGSLCVCLQNGGCESLFCQFYQKL